MIRTAALLLTVLTGFSGLVYEVTWEKYLATLLGSHSEATAALLGLYLGGLAIGYSLFGAVTTRVLARARREGRAPRLIVLYGLLEAGIGLWALIFAWLFRGAQALSLAVPQSNAGLAFGFDIALCALLILPPATLMGGTIPILTQALARGLEDATRFHALVYSFNTAGAFAGALAAGFWLVPTFGLVYSCAVMGIVNIGAGAVFAFIGSRAGADELAAAQSAAVACAAEGEETHRAISGFASFSAVALLTGFAMMSIQTVLIRVGGLAFGASHFTFSIVVAVFVLCIALGSFAVSGLRRIPRWVIVADLWLLFAAGTALYTRLPDAPYWAHALRALFEDDAANFYPYYLLAFAGMLAVIGLPVALSGAALPLIFHHLRDEVGNLGNAAGRLYSWNTLGSLLGAMLGGYALLFWFNLDQVYRIALGALCVSAVVVTLRVTRVSWIAAVALLLTPALVATAYLPDWDQQKLSAGLFRLEPNKFTFEGPAAFWNARPEPWLRFYADGPAASIAVTEQKQLMNGRVTRSIVTNGKSDSGTVEDYPTMALLGLLPALFAERAERAFVIGYGVGVTAGELAALETMREVTVTEISQGVIDAAPWFDYANVDASLNPRVRIVRGDAYRTLLRSDDLYDVIVSEPSNPWVIGVEMLYSREFLEAARNRLTPGGVYVQWMHTYEVNDESIGLVVRTYADVFDHVSVWYGTGVDLLLLGFNNDEAALDLDRLAQRAERPDFRAGLTRAGIDGLPALLAHEQLPLGVVHALSLEGHRHTLLHPRLAYHAARGFFVRQSGKPPFTVREPVARIGAENALLGLYRAQGGDRLSEDDWAALARETCRHQTTLCVTLLARWKFESRRSKARRLVIQEIRDNPELGPRTNLSAVSRLVDLYRPDGGNGGFGEGKGRVAKPAAEDVDPLLRARRVSKDFIRYYHHAVPFSRFALEEEWRRCEAAEGLREPCRRARSVAERTLGGLDVGGP